MIAIVDSKAMAYLEMHAGKPVVNLFDTITTCMLKVDSLHPYDPITKVVFAYDLGKSRYRLGLWERYKGNRVYTTLTSSFKDHYENIVPRVADALAIHSFKPYEVEADDIAGMLCGKLKDERIVLMTVDHDWFGLVLRHNHVAFFDVKKYEFLDRDAVRLKTNCDNENQFIIKKCIIGDSGDNIIGIPSVGPVTFKKWSEDVFRHPDSHDMRFLKVKFLELCDSIKSENKTHRDYSYAGVSSCEELVDFNIRLGTIMENLTLLDIDQKTCMIESHKSMVTDNTHLNIDMAIQLSSEYSDGYKLPFGDPYTISPVTVDYFKEIYARRRKKT